MVMWDLLSQLRYHSFITSHLHACPRMVPCRILCGNKIFHELACVALHDTRLTTCGQPTLDLLYHVWTIHMRLAMHGQPTLDLLYYVYHTWFTRESMRMITDKTSHNIIIPVGE